MATKASICLAILVISTVPAACVLAQCATPPPGLISWWPGDGDALDIVGTNHGTSFGGITFASAKVDDAFTFDGVDDYVTTGNDPSLRPDFPFSVEFWIYKDSPADFYGIASTDTDDNGLYSGFRVYVNTAGAVVTGIGNDEGCCAPDYRRNFFSADGVVAVNTWYHVAVVFERATSHLIYVDGVLQATTQDGLATTMVFGASNEMEIGRAFNPNLDAFQYGKGQIDELALYSAVIDPAKIQAICAAGIHGKCGKSVAADSRSWGAIKAMFGSV